MGFELVIGFIELLQFITTSKDYVLTVLHASQITIGHTRSSQFVTIFTIRCLVAASTADVPLPLVSRTVTGLNLQLLTATAENNWSLEVITKSPTNQLTATESDLLYDWRFTAIQFVLAPSPLRFTNRKLVFATEPLLSWSLCYTYSDERLGLSITNSLRLNQIYVSHI
jgi:hypothetical protein